MASYTTNVSNGYYLQLNINQISQNVANNTSYISYALYYKRGSRAGLSKTISWSFWLAGNNFSGSKAINISIASGNSSALLTSGNLTIYHDNYGNGSVAYSMSTGATSYGPTSTISGSGTNYLTQIPRQARITTAPNFNDEENPTISYNNPLGTGANSLQACISLTGEKADIVYRDISKNGTNYTFNLTEAERKLLRQNTLTSNNRQIKFFIRTIIGGNTLYDSVERTLSIVNNNPIFNDFVYEDIGIKSLPITENNQLLIKNFSNIKLTINNKMVAVKESTPKHYVITLDNRIIKVDYSNDPIDITIDNITFSGNKRLSVRAYDSRNNSTEVYKDIVILDYNKPQIFASISRKNQFEKETTLKINGKYDEVKINDISKNKVINLKYRYKETGGILSDWFNISINQLNGTYNCDDIILNLDNSKSFEFEIYAEDKLNTEILSIGVGVGIPVFFVSSNKKAIGVNCIPPDYATEGTIWFKGSDGLIKQVLDYDVIEEWEE